MHGIRKEYNHNGTLSCELRYKDGKMEDGTYTWLDGNGITRSEETYKDNTKIAGKACYKDGTTRFEFGPLEDPNLQYYKYYYEDGQLKEEQIAAKSGQPRILKRVRYYHNGKKSSEEIVTDDKKKTVYRTYDKEGNLKSEKSNDIKIYSSS